jgi:hypothetical protein
MISHLEAELQILKPISHVNSSMNASRRSMEHGIAGPFVVTNYSCLVRALNHAPSSLDLSFVSFIQQVTVYHRILIHEEITLALVLHRAEVAVVLNIKSKFASETSERDATSHLVLRCHHNSTFRHKMTVILNRQNGVMKTVYL